MNVDVPSTSAFLNLQQGFYFFILLENFFYIACDKYFSIKIVFFYFFLNILKCDMHEKFFAYLFTLVLYSLQIPVAIQFAPSSIEI